MKRLIKKLDAMTDTINQAVDMVKKDPRTLTIKEFIARQGIIIESNAVNRHRRCVRAGRRALSTMLRIKARTEGLKYILSKPLKSRKKKKIIVTQQLSLF